MRALLFAAFILSVSHIAAQPPGRPDRKGQPGPWDNDVLVYRIDSAGKVDKLATFERAGVPTVARLKDGRVIAAHQHFPADDDAGFDKVAVRFSSDDGKTWTKPEVIRLNGLPEGMRFPFDPTLVPLSDGRVRLYFTSVKGRTFADHRPAIYSAISKDGLAYDVELGVRFEIEGRPVIDCAVALHDGVFHLYAPDNGAGGQPGSERKPEDRPQPSTGYHATSKDGLKFTRQDDVTLDGPLNWLGNAVSDGDVIRFIGTSHRGIWTAESRDGQAWKRQPDVPFGVIGADPGAIRIADGAWLVIATGPPRAGTRMR